MSKEGFSNATGHNWELRESNHDKGIHNLEWDFTKKEWVRGRKKYMYCLDCKQFAWGAKQMCPKNVKVVYVPELVVSRGGK